MPKKKKKISRFNYRRKDNRSFRHQEESPSSVTPSPSVVPDQDRCTTTKQQFVVKPPPKCTAFRRLHGNVSEVRTLSDFGELFLWDSTKRYKRLTVARKKRFREKQRYVAMSPGDKRQYLLGKKTAYAMMEPGEKHLRICRESFAMRKRYSLLDRGRKREYIGRQSDRMKVRYRNMGNFEKAGYIRRVCNNRAKNREAARQAARARYRLLPYYQKASLILKRRGLLDSSRKRDRFETFLSPSKSSEWKNLKRVVVQRMTNGWIRAVPRHKFPVSSARRERILSDRYDTVQTAFENVYEHLCRDLKSVRKKFLLVDSLVMNVHDLPDRMQILCKEYGGYQYHTKSAESLSTRLPDDRYFRGEQNRIGNQHAQDQDRNCCQDGRGHSEIGDNNAALIRYCDESCEIGQDWASRLHNFLGGLDVNDVLSCVLRFVNRDPCDYCRLHEAPLLSQNDPSPEKCLCEDVFTHMRNAAPHFSGARSLLRRLYQIRRNITVLSEIDATLITGNWLELCSLARLSLNVTEKETHDSEAYTVADKMNSGTIDDRYGTLIGNFMNAVYDFPVHECHCCELLCQKQNLSNIEKCSTRKPGAQYVFNRIFNDITKHGYSKPFMVCKSCLRAMSEGLLPKNSRLNGMGVADNSVFRGANTVEKVVVQRMRCFQYIIRLKPYSSKRGHKSSLTSGKGHRGLSFYLPLPKETVKKTLENYSLPSLENLTIVVECPPTKEKKLYRYGVRMNKVLEILQYLKRHNPFYRDIEIDERVNFNDAVMEVDREDSDDEPVLASPELAPCLVPNPSLKEPPVATRRRRSSIASDDEAERLSPEVGSCLAMYPNPTLAGAHRSQLFEDLSHPRLPMSHRKKAERDRASPTDDDDADRASPEFGPCFAAAPSPKTPGEASDNEPALASPELAPYFVPNPSLKEPSFAKRRGRSSTAFDDEAERVSRELGSCLATYPNPTLAIADRSQRFEDLSLPRIPMTHRTKAERDKDLPAADDEVLQASPELGPCFAAAPSLKVPGEASYDEPVRASPELAELAPYLVPNPSQQEPSVVASRRKPFTASDDEAERGSGTAESPELGSCLATSYPTLARAERSDLSEELSLPLLPMIHRTKTEPYSGRASPAADDEVDRASPELGPCFAAAPSPKMLRLSALSSAQHSLVSEQFSGPRLLKTGGAETEKSAEVPALPGRAPGQSPSARPSQARHRTDVKTDTTDLPETEPRSANDREKLTAADDDTMLQLVTDGDDDATTTFSVQKIDFDVPNLPDVDLYRMKKIIAEPVFEGEENLDCLCFPALFPDGRFGYNHPRERRLGLSEYVSARMRHKSGRFRQCLPYVFHCVQQKNIKALQAGMFATLKTGSGAGQLTAGSFRDRLSMNDKQIERNLGTLMSAVPGTKEFCSRKFSEFCAMDEQLGVCTFFMTLSCAESVWQDMKDFLLSVGSLTEELIPTMADFAAVTRHFHRRLDCVMQSVILNPNGPLGVVENWAYRIEYQARGAPHCHMKLWVKGAPVVGQNSPDEVQKFVERYVTCRLPNSEDDPEMFALVNSCQRHNCTPSCYRKKFVSSRFVSCCRYGYPRGVRKTTVIHRVEDVLRARAQGKPTKLVELRRGKCEVFINNYNPVLLKCWGSNMDIQYVAEDSKALNYYVTCYIAKSETSATEELWHGLDFGKPAASRLMTLGRQMLNKRDIGGPEACDNCEQVSLFRTSVQTIYVSTAMPGDRRRLLKPHSEIECLPENSTDIFCQNMPDVYYPKRPNTDEFNAMSLIDFSTQYVVSKQPHGGALARSRQVPMLDGIGVVRPRRKHVVFRTNAYSCSNPSNVEKYFHSLLMTYVPYRDESELIEGYGSYYDSFVAKKDGFVRLIIQHRQRKALQDALDWCAKLAMRQDEENAALNVPENVDPLQQNDQFCELPMISAVDADSLGKLTNELNREQRKVFEKIVARVEQPPSDGVPLRIFVSGAGGCGKSHLIRTLRLRLQKLAPDEDACSVVVAVSAPTGIAASNVTGVTLHGLLDLPVQHGSDPKYSKATADSLKRIRAQFRGVRLLIIDEISMVSNIMLLYVNRRLREIFSSDLDFGGLNVLVLGDLLQLKPVRSGFVYEDIPATTLKYCCDASWTPNVWTDFEYSELTENMRQKGDERWIEILKHARIGSLTADDTRMLADRTLHLDGNGDAVIGNESASFGLLSLQQSVDYFVDHLLPRDAKAICILPKNDSVDEFNIGCLEKLDIPAVKIPCTDLGGQEYVKKKQKRKSKRNDVRRKNRGFKTSETAGLEEIVVVGLGARVMLRRNIDQKNGLVNGALGTVVRISYVTHHGKESVTGIDVKFDRTGATHTIKRVWASFDLPGLRTTHREQFPITLAYAITVHKSQGLSLDTVMLEIGDDVFEDAMGYVALSRCRKLENLFLTKFDPSRILCDQKSVVEINRLRHLFRSDLDLITSYNSNRCTTDAKSKKRVRLSVEVDGDIILPKKSKLRVHQSRNPECSSVPGYPRFSNERNSCFADATLHCLFVLQPLMSAISPNSTSALEQELLRLYRCWTPLVNCVLRSHVVRRIIGGAMDEGTQQSAWDFLDLILTAVDDRVSQKCRHRKIENFTCTNCGETRRRECRPSHFVFPFWVPDTHVTVSQFVDRKSSVTEDCRFCGVRCQHAKSEGYIPSPGANIMLIQIPKFDLDGVAVRRFRGTNSNRTVISGNAYRFVAAMEHLGTPTNGHYVAWTRNPTGESTWLRADGLDVQMRRALPGRLENITMLALERIGQ